MRDGGRKCVFKDTCVHALKDVSYISDQMRAAVCAHSERDESLVQVALLQRLVKKLLQLPQRLLRQCLYFCTRKTSE